MNAEVQVILKVVAVLATSQSIHDTIWMSLPSEGTASEALCGVAHDLGATDEEIANAILGHNHD